MVSMVVYSILLDHFSKTYQQSQICGNCILLSSFSSIGWLKAEIWSGCTLLEGKPEILWIRLTPIERTNVDEKLAETKHRIRAHDDDMMFVQFIVNPLDSSTSSMEMFCRNPELFLPIIHSNTTQVCTVQCLFLLACLFLLVLFIVKFIPIIGVAFNVQVLSASDGPHLSVFIFLPLKETRAGWSLIVLYDFDPQ